MCNASEFDGMWGMKVFKWEWSVLILGSQVPSVYPDMGGIYCEGKCKLCREGRKNTNIFIFYLNEQKQRELNKHRSR